MKQRIDESLTRLSEELADALPRRGFIRRLGAFVSVFTVFGAIERAFAAQAFDEPDCTPVIKVTLTGGGTGYPVPTGVSPALVFTGGGGSGATGTATVSAGGVITAVSLTAGGSGYTSAPTVTVAGGTSPGGTAATITASITCTIAAGCGETKTECGNAGMKCSSVVKTGTKPDPCCNCVEAKDDACPPPLEKTALGKWMACCLCGESTAANQIGWIYEYFDCCKISGFTGLKNPAGVVICPASCYTVSPDYHCPSGVEVDCSTGSAGVLSAGWCTTGGAEFLCTLPGTPTGKCCKWT